MKEYRLNFESNLMIDTKLRTNGFLVYELYEPVDGEKLLSSVIMAMKHHPVFRTKLIKKYGRFHLIPNKRKPIVPALKWEESLNYGNEETHDYPWIITYTDRKIIFISAHFLTDGGGQNRFMKTVLSYYFDFKVMEPDSKITRRTILEGYHETGLRKKVKTKIHLKEKEAATLQDSFYDFENTEGKLSFFTVDYTDITRISSGSDTSTFAVISALACKAVSQAAGIHDGYVTANIAVDLRSMFHSESDLSFSFTPKLYYPIGKLKGKDIALQATSLRSQLDICLDQDNINNHIAQMNTINGFLRPLVMIPAKKAFYENIRGQKANIVYSHMTYLGFNDFLEEKVKNVYLSGMSGHSPMILFHVVTYKDKINITLSENSAGNIISEEFYKILIKENIHTEYQKIPGHGMLSYCPECWD